MLGGEREEAVAGNPAWDRGKESRRRGSGRHLGERFLEVHLWNKSAEGHSGGFHTSLQGRGRPGRQGHPQMEHRVSPSVIRHEGEWSLRVEDTFSLQR